MASILLLTASPRADSYSTRMATELAQELQGIEPASTIVHRNLGAHPLPHIDELFIAAINKPAEARSLDEVAAIKTSDELAQELLASDTLVIGTGLINFGVYSSLKTWIDHVARAGLSFKYTENGPVGLATGKKAYIVLAAGGVYSYGPAKSKDHAQPHLETILGFLGITDIETIYVEGVAMGLDAVTKTVDAARDRIRQLAIAA